ncbi:hypothetical protein IE53DRAFT_363412, partial [Violaceomyces palustris]
MASDGVKWLAVWKTLPDIRAITPYARRMKSHLVIVSTLCLLSIHTSAMPTVPINFVSLATAKTKPSTSSTKPTTQRARKTRFTKDSSPETGGVRAGGERRLWRRNLSMKNWSSTQKLILVAGVINLVSNAAFAVAGALMGAHNTEYLMSESRMEEQQQPSSNSGSAHLKRSLLTREKRYRNDEEGLDHYSTPEASFRIFPEESERHPLLNYSSARLETPRTPRTPSTPTPLLTSPPAPSTLSTPWWNALGKKPEELSIGKYLSDQAPKGLDEEVMKKIEERAKALEMKPGEFSRMQMTKILIKLDKLRNKAKEARQPLSGMEIEKFQRLLREFEIYAKHVSYDNGAD